MGNNLSLTTTPMQQQHQGLIKLNELRAAKARVEYTLQHESTIGWGEDIMMWRQSLLDELAKIEKEIARVKSAISKMPQHAKYIVEVQGQRKHFEVVADESLVAPRQGFISKSSPLAQALEKSRDGQVIEMSTPRGVSTYKVISKVTP